MASLEQTKSQVQQARQQLEARRTETQQAQEQLKKSKAQISSQRALRQARGGGIQGREERRRITSQIEAQKSKVLEAEKLLSEFEQKQIKPVEQQIKNVEAAQAEAEQARNDILFARRALEGTYPAYALTGTQKKILQRLQTGEQVAIEEAVRDIEAQAIEELEKSEPLSPETIRNLKKQLKKTGKATLDLGSIAGANLTTQEIPIPSITIESLEATKVPTTTAQSLISSSNILNIEKTTKPYADIDVSAGSNVLVRGISSARDWISDNIIGSVEDFKKAKEFYSSELGAFVSASPTGESGTAYIRPPTLTEKADIVGVTSTNILTIDLAEIRKRTEKLERIDTKLRDLEKGNIDVETNTWTGSKKDYDKYEIELAKRGAIDTQVTAGLFGVERPRDIREFRFLTPRNKLFVAATLPAVVGETIGATLGELTSKLGTEDKSPKLTDVERFMKLQSGELKSKDIVLPFQARGTSFTEDGEFIAPTTKIELKKQITTTKQARGVGEFIGRIAPYINPAGEFIFVTEQVGKLGGELELTGGIKKGAVSYVKRYPFEAGLVGAGIAFKGIRFGARKGKLTKTAKFVEPAKLKVTDVKAKQVVNILEDTKRGRPKVLARQTDKEGILEISLKGKGKVKQTESVPSDILVGTVEETRFLGKLEIGKTGIKKKLETFKGTVEVGKDKFKEVIDFGDLTRITEIKGKKGVVKLVDETGEIVFSKAVKPSQMKRILEETKLKPTKTTLDIQESRPLTITEKDGRRVITDLQGRKVFTTDKLPDLKAKRITGEVKTEITKGKGKGVIRLQEDVSGFQDIITAGERKLKVKVSGEKGRIEIKQRKGQVIEFGTDKEVDIIRSIKRGKREISQREISPTIDREIKEATSVRILEVEGKPKLVKEFERKLLKGKTGKPKQTKDFDFLKDVPQDTTVDTGLKQIVSQEQKLQPPQVVTVPSPKELLKTRPKVKAEIPKPELVKGSGVSKQIPAFGTGKLAFQDTTQAPKVTLDTQEAIKLDTGLKQVILLDTKPKLETTVRLEQLPRQLEETKQDIRVKQELRQEVRLKQELKLDLKTEQQIGQPERLLQRPKQQITEEPKTPLKPKTPVVLAKPSLSKRLLRKAEVEPELFEVFTKKKGKEVKVGEFGTQKAAEKSLLKTLKTTLRAGGKIKKGEKVLGFGELELFKGAEFRPSKKEFGQVVQKKGKRFGTGFETSEAQFFRKKSGKKSKSKFGF